MKDSGIEWIGEIPEEWETRRIKNCILQRDGGAWGEEPSDVTENCICLRVADMEYDHLSFKVREQYTIRGYNRETLQRLLLQKGDVVIEKSGGGDKTSVGRAVIYAMDTRAVFSNFQERIRFSSSVDPKYALFLFSVLYQGGYIKNYIKQTTGIQNLDLTTLCAKERLCVPSQTIQSKIVDYLDRKCAEIDAVIARQEAVIEKLKEYKLSLITEAVTKGLNPDAPMKDSGVEWIGQIPEHWELHKFCWDYSALLGKMLDAKRVSGTQLHPYIKNVDVQWESINFDDLDEMDFSDDEKDRYTIRPGDLMICEGGEIGKCAIVPDSVPDGIYYQKALHRVRPRYLGSGSLRFLSRVMFCMAKNNCLNTSPEKATIAHLPGDALSQLRIPSPPFAEQEMIADYLDQKCGTIDEAVKKKRSLIDCLSSYKKSLIYEIVTGKEDV